MANRQFSQYLLSRGILTSDNAGRILAKSLHAIPKLSVIVLENGLITPEQADKLLGVNTFIRTALSEHDLNAEQLDELKKTVPDRSACVGQVLLDEGMVDLSTLAELFEQSKVTHSNSVSDAVNRMLEKQNLDTEEYFYIGEYVELFMRAIKRFTHTEVLVIPNEDFEVADTTYLTYQTMGGSLRLTAGCRMTGSIMLDMASRFSGDIQTEVNEMAIDCIEEFCNVVNGRYIVNMSGHNHDMDLDMPRTVENGIPAGDDVLSFRVVTEYGEYELYLSREGFLLNNDEYLGW